MLEVGIPTAGYWSASSREEALEVLAAAGRPLVVKADGLAAGKGDRGRKPGRGPHRD